jgi:hypothetical protein
MAANQADSSLELARVRQSMEQTCEGVIYLSAGPFDIRLSRAAGRLKVSVYALDGVGEALAECEAFDADAQSHGTEEVRHG